MTRTIQQCRTRRVCEEVSEIVTIIKAGITVEDVEKQMRNFTLNDRCINFLPTFYDYNAQIIIPMQETVP